ncbi:hypothetical protein [Streptomyces goshikiensis]|uniref:hypothetical protein n=1 Tax=Streptomyces goshikiensis TaxID=1942 RepID=UPI0036C1A48D
MRTALRTSIVTAALAGAMLVPAAGSAPAAPAPRAVTSAKAAAQDDRYAGQAVYIGNGMVAVLRNQAEGPEAWIRAVGPQWKPGDPYMVRVLTVLNRQQTTDSAFGASFELTEAETTSPVLVVTTDGVAKSYPLPKGRAGRTCAADSKIQDIGAGTTAELYMSSDGPKAVLRSSGSDTPWRILDRDFTTLDKSDGIIARIVNPSGSKPVFEWRTQGGGTPLGRTSFPSLPKGCELNHKVTREQTGAGPVAKPSPATTGVTPQTQARTPVQAQTAVVPKGAVAAGAELPVETVADTDDSTTPAAGAGLIAIVTALGAGVLRRRRNHG